MQNKVLSMLGISAKSGHVASGEFAVEKAVKSHQAYLVIVSEESSENTRKSYRNMTDFYRVPMWIYGSKEELGRCIGKEFRAAVAVTDANLAKAVEKQLLALEKLNNGGN